jgi:uncharacterized phage infection (PIP) family protein YhgE
VRTNLAYPTSNLHATIKPQTSPRGLTHNSRETILDELMKAQTIDKRKKYKQKQKDRGYVRFEVMLPCKLRDKFEAMAREVSNEYIEPADNRQKIAKAKIELLAEFINGTNHEFFTLKDKIERQAKLIEYLSPTFNLKDEMPELPEAIKALTNEPNELKQLLAQLYSENQSLKTQLNEVSRRAEQYLKLYELVSHLN